MGSFNSRRKRDGKGTPDALHGEVCLDHFDILRSIGRGSFGKVCIVQKKDTKKLFALKYMSKKSCIKQNAVKNVFREVEILKLLEHSFLVNLWYTFQDEEDMFMVLDLMLGGDIRYHINEGHRFKEVEVKLYVAEMGLALDYLQSKRIIHRDIKPDNLLLDNKGHIHISDFNIATVMRDGMLATSMSGTKPYMAPEIFATAVGRSQGYSFPVDWWSLGVTICEMIRGVRPFGVNHDTPVDKAYNLFVSELVLELPTNISDNMVRLLKKFLQPDPMKRIWKLEHLKQQPTMKNMDFDEVNQKEIITAFIPSKEHLNCDPTYELEEMIIEAKPLHKKKKRINKMHSRGGSTDCNESGPKDPVQVTMEKIEKEYTIFSREQASTPKDGVLPPSGSLMYNPRFELPRENGQPST